MSAAIAGFGHLGIYVQDIDLMTEFWRDFMGMQITKQSDGAVFFSSDPKRSDHEIVIMKGRPSLEDPQLINQISMRVNSLDDLRDFYHRIRGRGYQIDQLVTHASAIGCYFRDPEGNRTEVFWVTGLPSWAGVGVPIDIERSDAEVLADVHAVWDRVKHVGVGEKPDAETAAVIRGMRNGVSVPA
jgi:catechol-2,3-dioxygenase